MALQNDAKPITVHELCSLADGKLREAGSICVTGEVEFQKQSSGYVPGKHIYFNLKENDVYMPAIVWASRGIMMKDIVSGTQVIACGYLQYAGRFGKMSFIAETVLPTGTGKLLAEMEARKKKYSDLGYFRNDLKKKLPSFVRHISLVTSRQGAVIHDILDVLTRRAPSISVTLYPCMVQGPGADESIASQIRYADAHETDIIVVMRGGGSAEDLAPFSSDAVINAVFRARTPVISAVGHETDFPICDFVADVRAGTPSIAGSLIAELMENHRNALSAMKAEMEKLIRMKLNAASARLSVIPPLGDTLKWMASRQKSRLINASDLETHLYSKVSMAKTSISGEKEKLERNIRTRLDDEKHRLSILWMNTGPLMNSVIMKKRNEYECSSRELQALSPYAILKRGYSMARKTDGTVIRSPDDVIPGETVTIRTDNGTIDTKVVSVSDKTTRT